MGLLSKTETTTKAGLLNRTPVASTLPALNVTANSTPQTSFNVSVPDTISIQAPKTKEATASFPLTGTTISASKTVESTPLRKLVSKIKNPTLKDIVSGIVDAPRSLLFGDEQKRQEIKTMEEQGVKVPLSERIVSEGFAPSLGLSQTEIIDKKATDLIRKGVARDRAYEVASVDTLQRTIPKDLADMQRKEVLDKEEQKLAITDQERSTLRFTNAVQSIFAGLDVAGFIPVGATVENIGKNVARIAKSKDIAVITDELVKIGVAKNEADNIAIVLSKTDDPQTIEQIITETIKKAPEEKAGLLSRTTSKVDEAVDTTNKAPITETSIEREAKNYSTPDEFVNSFEKRYHQTTPEIESKIQTEGFKLGELGSGHSDVLPVGINTKIGDVEIGIKARGSQIESYFPKNTNIKTFESRDEAEKYFYWNIPEYKNAIDEVRKIDRESKKILDAMEKQSDELAKKNLGREVMRKEYDKQKDFIEKWSKKDLVYLNKAREASTKHAKDMQWDVLQINKDTGGFGRVTDNTIILKPELIKTKQQLTDIWKKANTVKSQELPATVAKPEVNVSQRTPEELAQGKERLAKRMESTSSKKPVSQFATIPKEVTSVEAKAEEYLSRVPKQYEKDVLALPDIVERGVTDVKNKVNVLDYLRTPDRILEKIGFSKEAKAVRQGYEAYIKELPKNIEKITEWSKRVPKESNERIFQYLDGKEITLDKEELAVANEIKTWLKDWAKRLDLPEDKQITHYITHIFDRELVKKEFDEELAKIITDRIPSSTYDPFLESRLGKLGYKQNTWEALDAYVKRATRKANMDKALEMINKKAGSTLDMAKIEASQFKYIQRYVNNINMRPTELDNLIDNSLKSIFGYKYGNRPVTYLTRLLRQMTYRGMLGLNPASALRNLSQGVNTYAKLGEKYTAIGYVKLFSKGALDELKEVGVLADTFIQDRALSSTKKAMEKIDKGLWAMFQTAEHINRGSAYFGAKAKALSQGMSEKEAIEYGKKMVRDTQFSFGSIDTPVALQNDIVKTLTQFQSYTLKQIEFLTEMAKNKEFMGLTRYAVGGLAFVYTIGQMFGMKPEQLLPIFRFDTPPSLKFPVEVAKAVLDSPDKYGQDRDLEEKTSDIAKSTIGLIPAGSQLKKTIEGLMTIQKGGSFDRGGNLQFEAPTTTEGKIQALLFGKYSTEKAGKYFDKSVQADKDMEVIQPIYNQIQEMKKAGKEEEALALYDSLGEKGKEVYKKVKSKAKAEETKIGKQEILPTFREIRKLKEEGKADEALQVYEALTDDEKKYYQLLKKQIEKGEPLPEEESSLKKNILKAFGVESASAMESPAPIDEKVAIPKAIEKVVEQAENIAPMIDKKYIQALVKQESSDGTDDVHRKYDQGKYGWLVGFTIPTYKNIVEKAKTQKKYKNLLDSMAGFDTPEDAIKSALVYSQFLLRDHTKEQQTGKREWKDINATQLYKLYNGGGSAKGVKSFDVKFNSL